MKLSAFHIGVAERLMPKKILLVMKITTLILIVAIMQVSASSFAQKLTLSENNVSLKKLLKEIKKQTGYNFIYTEGMLKNSKPVNIHVSEAPIEGILEKVFAGQRLSYVISNNTVVIKEKEVLTPANIIAAVPIKITGVVKDETGAPLPGVTVAIEGTGSATSTDVNGKYTITADSQQTLVFSFIGYKTVRIPVNERVFIDIALTPLPQGLNEVIVVGYGTQKKVNLTGSVSTISSKDIQNLPISNLTNALVGRLPGLIATNPSGLPGSGSNLQIRGNSTLNDNSTLIVVDGVVRSDGFQSINPDDVANVTILKDAASTAVYGARAANGVILITTKRGATGKATITYSGNYGIQNPINYPKLMSAYDYATLRNEALTNQGFSQTNPTQALLFYSADQIGKFKQNIGITNWYDASFRNNSPQNQQNVSVSGGNDAVKYFTSVGYLSQNGMYSNINFKRYNFRSNLDAKINNNLNLTFNLEGRQEDSKAPGASPSSIFGDVIRQRPTQIAYYPNGLPANTSGEHPVEEIKNTGYNNIRTKTFVGTISLEQKLPFITPGLSIKGLASAFTTDSLGKSFLKPYKMYDEDANGNVTNTKVVGGPSQLTQRQAQVNNYLLNLSLNYARTFKKHDISVLLLGEQYQSTGNFFQASKNDFVSNIKDEFYASGPVNQKVNGTSVIYDTRQSLVGRVNYGFAGKYLLEASFRYDGSFRFAPGNQWGFFPAVSAGWRVSEEGFFKESEGLNFINNLKIRASKGLVGNDRVSPYQYNEAYVINTQSGPAFNNNASSLINYGVYPNADITWEKQNSNNIGLDADLFNSKLNFTFDYFFRKTSDILFQRVLSTPATFGRTLPAQNYAEMKSHGFEASIGYSDRVGKLGYNIRVNGSYATNTVTNIDDPANALDFQKQLGRVYGFIPGYQSLGFFQSDAEAQSYFGGTEFGQTAKAGDIKYADINGDGQITTADQKVLSYNNYTPRVIYGIAGGVSYQGFDFNFLVQGAAERDILLSGTARVLFQNGGSSNSFDYLKDTWSPTNTNAKYPQAWIDSRSINDRASNVWLKDASYARLKSADLGYTFNSAGLKSLGIQRLKVYVSGTNLLTFTKFKEFDPEGQTGSSVNATQTLQQTGAYYPQQRVISLGVNLGL